MKIQFIFQILSLIAGKNQKLDSPKTNGIPTGILELSPKIVYTPNVKASFDKLENAIKRYNLPSQKRLLINRDSKE